MKNLLTILFSILFVTKMEAQNDFAPIGAVWKYRCMSAFDTSLHTCSLNSVADTIIQGRQCKILKKNVLGGCDYRGFTEYMYSDSGKVFFFDSNRNIFQLLFDINANVGDHFSLIPSYPSNDSIVFMADSISSMIINSISLKVLYIHYIHKPPNLSVYVYNSKIIERIGFTSFMFPWDNISCAEGYTRPLGCYSDPILGFYDFGTITNCSPASVIEPEENTFSIFPNPNNGKFTVSLDSGNSRILIYNILGELIHENIYSGTRQNISIELPFQSKGIYIVKIQSEKMLIAKKVIIE
ncbi:MAG: T9SS type A sorting domain-containing protein [Bacteroidota bacterium]